VPARRRDRQTDRQLQTDRQTDQHSPLFLSLCHALFCVCALHFVTHTERKHYRFTCGGTRSHTHGIACSPSVSLTRSLSLCCFRHTHTHTEREREICTHTHTHTHRGIDAITEAWHLSLSCPDDHTLRLTLSPRSHPLLPSDTIRKISIPLALSLLSTIFSPFSRCVASPPFLSDLLPRTTLLNTLPWALLASHDLPTGHIYHIPTHHSPQPS
jgi:hypothetical protein